jgi:transcriptional regulator with XRE-family HTH domain
LFFISQYVIFNALQDSIQNQLSPAAGISTMPTLLELMKESGLNRNQVSKISGISNTYLTKIERYERDGAKINIRRKTLINIAVSLNLNVLEINELLKEYNHTEVSASDTPYFLAASENQNVTGILPLFSSLVREWFIIGLEKKLASTQGASMVYVLDQPSHTFRSPEHASYMKDPDQNPVVASAYKDLIASACLHRRKLITEALEKGNLISTYVCANCLENYTQRWKKYKGTDFESTYKKFLKEHIEMLIHYIETYPDRYRFKLLKKCPRIKYQMLYLPTSNKKGEVENKISKVFFHAQESDCNIDKKILGGIPELSSGLGFGDLIGFATDLQNILEFFHKQHSGLKNNFSDERYDRPEEIVSHLKALTSDNID